MNVTEQARQAYAPTQVPIRTPRSVEAQVLSQITARLKRAADFPALAAAIHDNRRLWAMLAADVATAANGLPAELRAQIFYLAEFTDQHSGKVLRRLATPEALVDINTAVLRGLNQRDGA